eukprot:1189271-Prorocentrum_minimum.AAC.4
MAFENWCDVRFKAGEAFVFSRALVHQGRRNLREEEMTRTCAIRNEWAGELIRENGMSEKMA